jgi:hypothetical protein
MNASDFQVIEAFHAQFARVNPGKELWTFTKKGAWFRANNDPYRVFRKQDLIQMTARLKARADKPPEEQHLVFAKYVGEAAFKALLNAYNDKTNYEMAAMYAGDSGDIYHVAALLKDNKLKEAAKAYRSMDTGAREYIPDDVVEFILKHEG